MSLKTAVQTAHFFAHERLEPGATAVDATAGNGHDTLRLAQLVGEKGKVYAFDIQPVAIENTAQRLKEVDLLSRVTLIQDSHHNASQYLSEQNIDFVLFNLGYLPGGDKSIVTQPDTTKLAVEQLLNCLKPKGLLVLVLYPGHPEGQVEASTLETWVKGLDQQTFTVQKITMINQVNQPPYVIAIEKRGRLTHFE